MCKFVHGNRVGPLPSSSRRRLAGLFGFSSGFAAWTRQYTQAIDFLSLGSRLLPGSGCLAQDSSQTGRPEPGKT